MRRNDNVVDLRGTSVEVGDNFEKALRQFNRLVQNKGVVKECRARQTYTKPSETKQLKRKEAQRAWRKKQIKMDPRMAKK